MTAVSVALNICYKTLVTTNGTANLTILSSSPWLLAERIDRDPQSTIIERKSPLGNSWVAVSARSFGEDVARIASGLMGLGLERGQAVGIMVVFLPDSYSFKSET